MLTKEQWQDAARFAGLRFVKIINDTTIGSRDSIGTYNSWSPLTDWSDFGPLFVLLLRWERNYVVPLPFDIMAALHKFQEAKYNGTDTELMQSGLLLAAAIERDYDRN